MSNPLLSDKKMRSLTSGMSTTMTIQGAINKTGILTIILLLTAGWTWNHTPAGTLPPLIWIALFGGLGIGLAIIFNPHMAPLLAPVYAIAEGIVLGMISSFYEAKWNGIVSEAVLITLGILIAMLLIYKLRIIKVTKGFIRGVTAATFGVLLIYIVSMFIPLPILHDGGWKGILLSLVIIGIASMNLIIDFHQVEFFAERGAPKYIEWYCGFSILVTLVWLYLEILRLLANSRD